MRSLLLFLAASLPLLGSTVTCTGSDASAIQTSLNAGGTTTLIGSCNIGTTTLGTNANGTTLTTTTGASVTYTGTGFALNINHNSVTVTNITWTGGGLHTTQTSQTTPQSSILIDSNIIQNITMANGNNIAILGDGYWSFVTITNNTIRNITSVPFGQITSNTNVENCTPASICTSDQYPCTWSGGINNCFGSGITNVNGLDNTTIQFNHFDTILGNAMSLKYAWTLSSAPGAFTSAANNNWSYNTAVNLHRMMEESGGVNGCPGPKGCLYGSSAALITNWKIAGNFATYLSPYGDSYGLSIPDNAGAPQIINNTFALTQSGNAGFTYENGNQNELFQGNVASINSGLSTNWGQQNSSAVQAPGFTVFQQNNIFFGPPGNLAGLYYGSEGFNYGGTFTNRFNVNGASCSSCGASTLATAFITSGSPSAGCTANAASFPTGGNGTWCFYATNQLSIQNVQFFLDGSSTPTVTQEIQDLSSTFTSDARWQYHATINTSSLSGGSHTILATATDVSGATSSHSQTFTTGSGPGASFSPTLLAFGTITLGNSSSPQVTTLTNTGTTTLTITGGVTITGANAGDFSKTTTCGSTVAASATCTVTITFTPTALGPRVAFVSITDNAAGSPHQVQLTGGASLCLSGNIVSNCDLGTGVLSPWGYNGGSFGTIAVDNTGPSGTFAAHITAIAPVSPGSNDEFFQDGLTFGANGTMMQLKFSCQATRSQPVNILGILSVSPFTSYGLAWMPSFPTSYGTYPNCKSPFFKVQGSPTAGSGRLTFQADNSTTGDQFQITNVNLVPAGSVPASTVSVSSIVFGSQNVGTTQTGTPFTITNDGIANLVISSIAYSTGNASDFGQTNNCTTVAPASTCTITTTFTPSNPGARVTSLIITSNDSSQSPQSIPVSGIGAAGSGEVTNIIFPYYDHAAVAVGFTTQTDSNQVRIRYTQAPGSCTSGTGGTVQNTIDTGIKATYGQISIGGLAPATNYQICPEVSKDGGTTFTTGAGASLVTQPLPAVHPSLPIAPIKFDTSYPDTTSYGTYNVLSDCSDFGSGGGAYATALANWALSTPKGTVINIPAGTVCTTTFGNPYAFSGMPPDVHVWRSADLSLPSTFTWTGGNHPFAEGDLVSFGRSYVGNPTPLTVYPASTSCDVGYSTLNGGGIQSGQRYQVHVLTATTFQIRCLPDTQYDPAIAPPTPAIMVFTDTGTDNYHGFYMVPWKQFLNTKDGLMEWKRVLPNGTPTPQIIVRSAAPDSQLPPEGTQITSAWASKMATFLDPAVNATTTYPASNKAFLIFGDPDSNIEAPIGNIRLGPGIEITTADYNGSVHSSDPAGYSNILITYPWDSSITYDRIWYHMLGAPNRVNVDMPWNGAQLASVDSIWDNMTYFHANNTGLAPTRNSNTQFTIATGVANGGFGPITLSTPAVCTISGSGTGTIFVYDNLLSGSAFTVAVPTGITATCTGTTAVSAVSAGSNGSCNATDGWPKTGSNEVTVAQIACVTVSSGVIGTATAATPWYSPFNPEGDGHMIGGWGPGPYIFSDNYSDGAGVIWHWDASGAAASRGDYTVFRNYLFTNPKYLPGSPTSDGLRYFDRQVMEHKGGQRINEIGNIFDTTWRDDTPDGTFYALTPLFGAWITDVNFQYNTFRHGSAVMEGINTTCPSDVPTSAPCARPAVRYRFQNNLAYDIDGFVYTAHNPGGSNGPGEGWNFQLYGVGDMIVDHNTYAQNRGNSPDLFTIDGTAVEGYQHTGNIEWITGVPSQTPFTVHSEIPLPPPGCTGLSNIDLINCAFTQGLGTTSYNWAGNLVAGGYTDSSVPSGQITTSAMGALLTGINNTYLATGTVAGTTTAIKWMNPTIDNALYNYSLQPGSSYKAGNNTFDKGSDLGADMLKLNAAQGLVTLYGTPASGITTTSFSVSYLAADSAVDHVGYSTTNDITTATWVADSGGARARNTAITGLASHTHFYYWVLGSGNSVMSQRSGDVWTNN